MRKPDYKWTLIAFLFVTFFLEQAARQVYGATLPQIKLDFAALGVDDARLGLVSSVFTLVFGVALVGSGLAADFLGRKRVIVVGSLLFSLGVLTSGFATGLGLMVVAYGVVNALGQCCIAPPAYSLISQHHTNETRSTAMGIFQSAVYIGVILSSVTAGALAQLGPGRWRWAFWAVGGLGLVWTLVLAGGLRDTPQEAGADDGKASVREAFAALVRKPTAVLIAVAFGMFMYAGCGLRLWSVAFVHRSFEGVSLSSAAFHAVFWFYAGALVGLGVTARLVDRFGRRVDSIRLDVSILGFLLCVVPALAVSRATTRTECCAALTALGLATGVYEAAHYPAMFDCIAPRYRSAATGLTGCLAFVIGAFAPVVMGWMNDSFSIRAGMASLSGFYLLGALVLVPARLWFFKRDYIGYEEVSR